MKYLLSSGSLRTDSLNKKLIKVAHKTQGIPDGVKVLEY